MILLNNTTTKPMENEFVPYELAVKLKELGFDEPCMSSKDMNNSKGLIQLPLYQQAFRWFREKYNLRGFIGFRPNVKQFDHHIYDMSLSGMEYVKQRTLKEYNKDPLVGTYEEAELACLNKLIEIVTNEQTRTTG